MRILDPRNNRGIALLIVLLVTALLIALVFEFAYATRISLNSAMNYRDGERAYFLALTGINAFKASGQNLRDMFPAGQWQPVPLMTDTDTQIMLKWEDESGKIKITDLKTDTAAADARSNPGPTLTVLRTLFETMNGIDTGVLDRMADPESDFNADNVKLLSELHRYMNAADFDKVAGYLTVMPVSTNKLTINVNTASEAVLQSLGIPEMDAKRIVDDRQQTPYVDSDLSSTGRLSNIVNIQINGQNLSSFLVTKSAGFYTVYSSATVGGYTKVVEAILNGSSVYYWKAL